MAGRLLLGEFRAWTIAQTAAAWSFAASVPCAPNRPRDRHYLCARALDSYRRLLREDAAAPGIFATVTAALVAELVIENKAPRRASPPCAWQYGALGPLKPNPCRRNQMFMQIGW